jgi:hypothetical protein
MGMGAEIKAVEGRSGSRYLEIIHNRLCLVTPHFEHAIPPKKPAVTYY